MEGPCGQRPRTAARPRGPDRPRRRLARPTPPTADNPWGCPYVQRDGQRNPEVDSGTDRQDAEKVFDSTYDLALAWYYTGRRDYAEKAGQILRTWFLDPPPG